MAWAQIALLLRGEWTWSNPSSGRIKQCWCLTQVVFPSTTTNSSWEDLKNLFQLAFLPLDAQQNFLRAKKFFARKKINLKFNKKFLLFGAKESKYLNLEVKTNDAKAFYLKTAF